MEKKFYMDWDNEILQEEFINNILADEDLAKIRSLVIGRWTLGGVLGRGKLPTDNRHVC